MFDPSSFANPTPLAHADFFEGNTSKGRYITMAPNVGPYRFSVDYQKLNAIMNYPRYPLPLIDDLIMNIPHTGIMSALDLRTGYFQMAVNPSDIVKTAFVTKMVHTPSAECHLACQGQLLIFRKQ
ncbi:hypothetical protein TNCV_2182361 [Trichonephila clavipes]|uniref:Reverse transcriptase domain-containing protein n=1 Tax=Trichonephila clavipes TaxID=2585209 RepID=A0A8X6VV46_TRICX|nr:hypothetical protein TNCV_2182361 [Trichonephila clavipes]